MKKEQRNILMIIVIAIAAYFLFFRRREEVRVTVEEGPENNTNAFVRRGVSRPRWVGPIGLVNVRRRNGSFVKRGSGILGY